VQFPVGAYRQRFASTALAAARIADAVQQSGALSIEVFVASDDPLQSGPPRLVTYSLDPSFRNFTVGPVQRFFDFRLRTSITGSNASTDALRAGDVLVDTEVHHLVFTYDGNVQRVFVDGALRRERATIGPIASPGDSAGWDRSMRLLIGDEDLGPRQFFGRVYLVALHDRALDAATVRTNLRAGLPLSSDDDGDGVVDTQDNCVGLANPLQADSDGDQRGNPCDPCPLLAQEVGDLDADGLGDVCDQCPAVADPFEPDTDADDTPDACDLDDDNDGIGDPSDACPLVEGASETDTDNDGVPNDCDNCVTVTNDNQFDMDEDGEGDRCDADRDNDGFLVDSDAVYEPGEDNCPDVANPDQADADNDDVGDRCDNDLYAP
jgi:hypothetical protein